MMNECGHVAFRTRCVVSFGLLLVMIWICVHEASIAFPLAVIARQRKLVPPCFEVVPGFLLAWRELWIILTTSPEQGLSKSTFLLRRATNCNLQVVAQVSEDEAERRFAQSCLFALASLLTLFQTEPQKEAGSWASVLPWTSFSGTRLALKVPPVVVEHDEETEKEQSGMSAGLVVTGIRFCAFLFG